jgi:hypothetical protein
MKQRPQVKGPLLLLLSFYSLLPTPLLLSQPTVLGLMHGTD